MKKTTGLKPPGRKQPRRQAKKPWTWFFNNGDFHPERRKKKSDAYGQSHSTLYEPSSLDLPIVTAVPVVGGSKTVRIAHFHEVLRSTQDKEGSKDEGYVGLVVYSARSCARTDEDTVNGMRRLHSTTVADTTMTTVTILLTLVPTSRIDVCLRAISN